MDTNDVETRKSDQLIRLGVRLESLRDKLRADVRPGHPEYMSKASAANILDREIEEIWALFPHLQQLKATTVPTAAPAI